MARRGMVRNEVEDQMIAAIDDRSGASAREQEERKLVREFVLAQQRARHSERSESPRRRRIVAHRGGIQERR